MGFKKQIRFLHKWLGLISGLIVFIISITGCIFCFHDEIKDITRKEWRLVEPQNKPFVLPSVLQEKAKEILPNYKQAWFLITEKTDLQLFTPILILKIDISTLIHTQENI